MSLLPGSKLAVASKPWPVGGPWYSATRVPFPCKGDLPQHGCLQSSSCSQSCGKALAGLVHHRCSFEWRRCQKPSTLDTATLVCAKGRRVGQAVLGTGSPCPLLHLCCQRDIRAMSGFF